MLSSFNIMKALNWPMASSKNNLNCICKNFEEIQTVPNLVESGRLVFPEIVYMTHSWRQNSDFSCFPAATKKTENAYEKDSMG